MALQGGASGGTRDDGGYVVPRPQMPLHFSYTRSSATACLVAVRPPPRRRPSQTKMSSCEKQAWLASNYCDAFFPSPKLKEITPLRGPSN